MSQYPPNPQYPGNYPPPPPPGMPVGPGAAPYPAAKTSGAAITALIMGLLLCIPFLTGLGGVIFGAVGLSSTKDPRVTGRGMAITGIVLGLLNIVLWVLFGGAAYQWWRGTEIQREAAKAFVQELTDGKVADAQKRCDPKYLKASDLQNISGQLRNLGTLQSVTVVGVEQNVNAGTGNRIVVAGGAQYATRQVSIQIIFEKQGNDWKIVGYNFQ